MAAALARGLHRAGATDSLAFADSGSGRAAQLAAELDGAHAESLAQLAGLSDVIVLAMKPAALPSAAAELADHRGPLVSVLGATPLERLREAFPGAPLLRAMPNVAVEVGRGVICHAPADADAELEATLAALREIATLVELREEQIDVATAVMGCSPAYLALACAALIEAGHERGLDAEQARGLVSEAAAGAGELLAAGHDPAQLQRAVASPGGSTEAGLEALRAAGVPEAFRGAVVASLERMAGAR